MSAEQQTDSLQFVMFWVGNEVFAVELTPVQEIIRVPEVVGVPMAPPSLDGLANLRGKILPIISLRRIFGFDERAYDDATRAVVIDLGQPLGFVVDRVASVVAVERANMEPPGAIQGAVDSDLLSGLLKDVGGHKMVMVLDFGKLIASQFARIGATSGGSNDASLAATTTAAVTISPASTEMQFVSFEVAKQEYAIAIEDVQEIVQVPDLIIHVPHAREHVVGLMTLRNRLLPLVSLRRMFGLPNLDADEQSRIVVVALRGASVGMVVDRVNEVLRVPRSSVDLMPEMLARSGNPAQIQEVCKLNDGKRLVAILSVQSMFRHEAVREAVSAADTMREPRAMETTKSSREQAGDEEEQIVVFRLGKEEFGVPIDSVQEIVRLPDDMTRVPKAHAAVEGVINLRGAVLPVIDLRRRLGLPAVERSDRQRIIVLLISGVRTGFIVDLVAEVLKIARSAIESAPSLSGEQQRLLSRMANLGRQKRMVQLIDPRYLIETQQPEGLSAVAAA